MTSLLLSTAVAWVVDSLGWNADDPSLDRFGVPVLPGPYIPPMPDRLVIITKAPGSGFLWEGSGEGNLVQIRVRGMQSPRDVQSYADAESLASQLDSLIYGANFPITVNNQLIIRAWRSGSAPVVLGAGPDDADRYEFACNYAIITGV